MAQIWHCCGCGAGQRLQGLATGPLAWKSPYATGGALKKTKDKRQKKKKISDPNFKIMLYRKTQIVLLMLLFINRLKGW